MDENSFEQIYNLYFKDVYCYLLSLCQNTHQAEELTQETFFSAMKSIASFRGDCKMTVWLCQIAKHLYFSDRKKHKKHNLLQEKLAQHPAPAASLERLLCDEADAMQIHELLHQLDEPYKEVFMLRIFGELSYKKIAHIFGKTESWARVTCHRARLKIIRKLEETNGKDIL